LFPILEEQQAVVEQIRKILFEVIKSHKPDKFSARLTLSRDQSHNLKVQFKAADYMIN